MELTFLMCSERSGSNLLTQIMNAHSQYCGPSPVHLIRILLDHRQRYGDLQQEQNWQMLCSDAQALFEAKTGVWLSEWPELDDSERTVAALIRAVYQNEAQAAGKPRVFIKENHLYRYLPFVLSNFPEARVVYLVRDPRDMALSWKKSPVLRGGVLRAANVWQTDQQQGLKVYQWLAESGKIFLLRYEDLLAQPEQELRALCAFLEIPFEYQMLEFQQNQLTQANAQRSAMWQNLGQPLLPNNFNKFKKELSITEIMYIEAVCQNEMQALGYPLETATDVPIQQLVEQLEAQEPWEKEGYQKLSAEEKQIRQQWQNVVERIKRRKPQPLRPNTAVAALEVTSRD